MYKTRRKTQKRKQTQKKQTQRKQTQKKQTQKRKRKQQKKQTHQREKGGGPPYTRPTVPCKYAGECRRTNPQHFIDFTHPKPYPTVKQFIQECYVSYTAGEIFAHLEHGSIQFLKKGIDSDVQRSFLFNLLAYIVCNICPLLKRYGKDFLSTMLMRFNEESVDITVRKADVDTNIQDCMTRLHIESINSIEILTALNNPGCIV